MAARKTSKEDPEIKAPEEGVDKAPEKDADNQKEATEKEKKKTNAKVYNLTSENKFLTVAVLGIQFIGGKASTTSLEIARELVKISGVALVEE